MGEHEEVIAFGRFGMYKLAVLKGYFVSLAIEKLRGDVRFYAMSIAYSFAKTHTPMSVS